MGGEASQDPDKLGAWLGRPAAPQAAGHLRRANHAGL